MKVRDCEAENVREEEEEKVEEEEVEVCLVGTKL